MKIIRYLTIVTASLFLPLLASAHGVGQVYNLPIPLQYYLGAAGLAVAFSFFIFAIFANHNSVAVSQPKQIQLRWLKSVILACRGLTGLLILLFIATGIFGNQDAVSNFAPVYFWIFFVLGYGILSLIVGNFWAIVNPWKSLSNVLGLGQGQRKISAWVGVILVLGLYWLELCSGKSFIPQVLGGFLLIYSLINLICAHQFSNWFEDGELFSVLFGFIGNLALIKFTEDGQGIVYLPLSYRLSRVTIWSNLGLASVLLAGTSFDSYKETVSWFKVLGVFHLNHLTSYIWPNTFGLVLFPIPFALIYLSLMWLMRKFTTATSFKDLALRFIWSLVPIAFGYTLAHNFSLVIVTMPTFYKLLSDPFGFGWNLFHTATINYNLIMGARVIWFIEISLVVLAHIIATYFAHKIALRTFRTKKEIIVSQFPTLILMVAFTVTTLWLLSQPLVISK